MTFALDDVSEGGRTPEGGDRGAPVWLKIAISLAAVAVVGSLVLIDTEPREPTADQATTTSALTPVVSSTTTPRPPSVAGAQPASSGEEETSGATGRPAFIARPLSADRPLRSGTLYAVSAFGELISADLESGTVSLLAEGVPTTPEPELVATTGGVVVATADGIAFYQSSGGKGPRPIATSVVNPSSASGLLPFGPLVGFVDRTPAGSRVTIASVNLIDDGVILKPFGEFTVPAAAEILGGTPESGLHVDLAGEVAARTVDGAQSPIIGGAGVTLASDGVRVARLTCDPQSSVCFIDVLDTQDGAITTFELPVELEGTSRDQLAANATFSPSGRYLALIGRVGGLRAVVFDLEAEEVHFSPEALGVATGTGTLTWADDDIAVYALESEVNAWSMGEVETGRTYSLDFRRSMVALAFGP